MIGAELVRMAADLIEGQQEESGPPQDLFPVLAARWSPVLGTEITPAQVVLCLLDLKTGQSHFRFEPGAWQGNRCSMRRV
jgi:hypothetical protein